MNYDIHWIKDTDTYKLTIEDKVVGESFTWEQVVAEVQKREAEEE